jgi:hypothetical protein
MPRASALPLPQLLPRFHKFIQIFLIYWFQAIQILSRIVIQCYSRNYGVYIHPLVVRMAVHIFHGFQGFRKPFIHTSTKTPAVDFFFISLFWMSMGVLLLLQRVPYLLRIFCTLPSYQMPLSCLRRCSFFVQGSLIFVAPLSHSFKHTWFFVLDL